MAECGLEREKKLTRSSQVAFKTFLNITPTLSFPPASVPTANPNLPQPSEFILTFDENPLAEFADLPRDAKEGGLWFSNVLCGVIRGALEMVRRTRLSHSWISSSRRLMTNRLAQIQLQVEAKFLSDTLRGDDSTDLHVRLIRIMEEEQPENDE